MKNWRITIEAWPFSTGEGHANDQKACGERSQTHETYARDIRDALVHAELICQGITRNPRVWQAVIVGIERIPGS